MILLRSFVAKTFSRPASRSNARFSSLRYAGVEYGDVREGCHKRERILENSSAPPLAHNRAEIATPADEVGRMEFLIDEDAIRRLQSTPIIDDEPLRRKPSRRRQDHCGKARERGIFGIVDICEKQFSSYIMLGQCQLLARRTVRRPVMR